MTNPFEVVAGFLERFDAEVRGRESGEPPEEVRAKLRSLALGTLPPGERAALFSQLEQNPEWVASLAQEVKALRANPVRAS